MKSVDSIKKTNPDFETLKKIAAEIDNIIDNNPNLKKMFAEKDKSDWDIIDQEADRIREEEYLREMERDNRDENGDEIDGEMSEEEAYWLAH